LPPGKTPAELQIQVRTL